MTIGLVLSGGGARGIAHLGVLQALKEEGVELKMISGVSSGAITGALYAAGMNPTEALEIIVKTPILRYLRPALNKFGFLNINRLASIFEQYFPVKTFEELAIKTFVTATDIEVGETVIFEKGEIIPSILASSAMPVVFAPVKIKDRLYIDGGVLNNLPVEPLEGKCDYIIGVHTNPLNHEFNVGSIRSVLERTFQLAVGTNVKTRIYRCNHLIEPAELSRFSLFDISKARDIYKIGYNYGKLSLAKMVY